MPEDSLEEYWEDLRRKPEPEPKPKFIPSNLTPEQLREIVDSVPFSPPTLQEALDNLEVATLQEALDNLEVGPILTIHESGPILTIRAGDRMMVEIHSDGTLRFGENYIPTEAARIFWEAVATLSPVFRRS
jgi:hypothetical protein